MKMDKREQDRDSALNEIKYRVKKETKGVRRELPTLHRMVRESHSECNF